MTIDVERARSLTPGCREVVHLNNAGAALMPQPVVDALHAHIDREAAIGGYDAADEAADRLAATYESIARLIGARSDEIAFVDSATRAWHSGFHAVPLAPGQRILTTSAEYASNAMSIGQVVARTGAEAVLLPDDERGAVDLGALDAELERGDVGLVAVTHVATSNGAVTPVAEIGRRCRSAGVPYLLDACQSVGQLRVDVDEIGCDLLAATGRKFLRGPRGTGFLYVRSSIVEQLVPPVVDLRAAEWTGPFSYRFHADARRFETWERSVAGHLGLGAAVDHLLGWGIDAVEERVVALAEQLRIRLADVAGVRVHDKSGPRCGIVTFTREGVEAATLADQLSAAGVNVWVSPGAESHLDLIPRGLASGVVRASVHYYNTEAELDRAIEVISTGT
ncbi:MAG: aminotransferase class V-fold PLP-dependent enzyme [Acidimicrobiia bacterium]|nr:aminotransferase class V-fold PLP-dependent enzyme [Acidimicrobiia bacterium]